MKDHFSPQNEDLIKRLESAGQRVYLSGLNEPTRSYLERAGVIKHLGEDRVFWNASDAIMAADHYRAKIAPHELPVAQTA